MDSSSIGIGGVGEGTDRFIKEGAIIAKLPISFNKGHRFIVRYFWDARVQFNRRTKQHIFPNQDEIESHPIWDDIYNTLDSTLALQALFPMTSTEMPKELFKIR